MQLALAVLVLGAQELVRTGFPNFYLTEQQITDIATKLDVSLYPRRPLRVVAPPSRLLLANDGHRLLCSGGRRQWFP